MIPTTQNLGGTPQTRDLSGMPQPQEYDPLPTGSLDGVLGDSRALKRINTRRSTDACCCFVFCLVLLAMGSITYDSVLHGSPDRLYHGFDYEGRLCGVDEGVVDKPLIYWPRPTRLAYPTCIAACPANNSGFVTFPRETVTVTHTNGTNDVFTEISVTEELIPTYMSHRIGGRFCLPSLNSGLDKHIGLEMIRGATSAPEDQIKTLWEDLSNAWLVLIFMVPLAIGTGYFYFYLLNYCARVLTWIVLFGTTLCFLGLSVFCLHAVAVDGSSEVLLGEYVENPTLVVQVTGWVAMGLCIFELVTICYFRQTVGRVLGCIEAACEAMFHQPLLLSMPIMEVSAKIVFLLVWLWFFTYVLTNGDLSADTAMINGVPVHSVARTFTFSTQHRVQIGLYIAGLIWVLETMATFCQFVIAYAVCIYYFTPCNPDLSKLSYAGSKGIGVLWRGVYYGCGYHLGSLALASSIAAVFRPVRWILQLLATQADSAESNAVSRCVAQTCVCCVWVFREIVRFMGKNAIIYMVLHATSFCTSASEALFVLEGAAKEVVALNGITFVFQGIGSVAITAAGAFLAFWVTENLEMYSSPQSIYYVENSLVVVLFAAILCFTIAMAFMFIFDLVSDTLLFCWLTDAEDGETEFAPKAMRQLIGRKRVFTAEQQQQMQPAGIVPGTWTGLLAPPGQGLAPGTVYANVPATRY